MIGKGLLLDLGITSTNIRKAVTKFEKDSDTRWTPYSMAQTAPKTISKETSDQRAIIMNVTQPCNLTNNKKRLVINFRNPEGWERYKTVSEEHAQEIKDLIDNIEDINELRIWIHIVNMDIQIESFGISW